MVGYCMLGYWRFFFDDPCSCEMWDVSVFQHSWHFTNAEKRAHQDARIRKNLQGEVKSITVEALEPKNPNIPLAYVFKLDFCVQFEDLIFEMFHVLPSSRTIKLASCLVDNPLSRLQVPARAHAAVRSLPRGPGRGKMDVSGNGVYPKTRLAESMISIIWMGNMLLRESRG
jgi:hypothetical protein